MDIAIIYVQCNAISGSLYTWCYRHRHSWEKIWLLACYGLKRVQYINLWLVAFSQCKIVRIEILNLVFHNMLIV